MTLNYVEVVCDVYDGQGNVRARGVGSFAPSQEVKDTADHLLIDPGLPIAAVFHVTGPPSAKLLATDQGNIAPSGWQWVFTPPAGSGVAAFPFYLPSSPVTQYLSDLAGDPGAIPVTITDLDGGTALTGAFPAGSIDGGDA